MTSRFCVATLTAIAAVGLQLATSAIADPPPPLPRTVPGVEKGRIETRWLAPYVATTTEQVGSSRTTSVRWFDEDGEVVREVSGAGVHSNVGFVYENANGLTTIHAVNGDWKLPLPKKPGRPGHIKATADSRTFVHQFHPREGQTAVDVYLSGKLASTIGPFDQYEGGGVQLGEDGSLAFLAWKSEENKIAQVVVVGPDAKVRFQADCGELVCCPIVGPDGTGVLVRSNADENTLNTFTFYNKSGTVRSLDIRPNPGFIAWLPGSSKTLFQTSIGYDNRYQLIDWETGNTLWDIPEPARGHRLLTTAALAVEDGFLLLGGLEFMKLGDREGPVRSIYAVDLQNGEVVSHWLPSPLYHFSLDGGSFIRLGEKLFLVSNTEVAEIELEDIAAKSNGWQ